MRIAYVEDDEDALKIFSEKFRIDGYVCDTFGSAEEALKTLTLSAYDVLVIDIRLPGISGVELLSGLHEQGVFAPCVLITAFNSMLLAKQALNANANYLLEKPFKYVELKKVIEKVLAAPNPLEKIADRAIRALSLTSREKDVARLMLKGLSNAEIAKAAKLSEKTVKQYVTQVFEKAQVASRAEFFSSVFPI